MTCNLINEPIKSAQENIITLLDADHMEVLYKKLVYGLARLPLVNSFAMASHTALQLGWEVGQEFPKHLLQERNVVEEGMIKRTNQIGLSSYIVRSVQLLSWLLCRLVVTVTV